MNTKEINPPCVIGAARGGRAGVENGCKGDKCEQEGNLIAASRTD